MANPAVSRPPVPDPPKEPPTKRYKVVGPHRVGEVDPGGYVELALSSEQERALFMSGHIEEPEDEPTSSSEQEVEPAAEPASSPKEEAVPMSGPTKPAKSAGKAVAKEEL